MNRKPYLAALMLFSLPFLAAFALAQIRGQLAEDFVAGTVPSLEEIAKLEAEVAAKPDDFRLTRKLAKGYFFQFFGEGRAGSMPKAEKLLEQALTLRKDDPETLAYLGTLYALSAQRLDKQDPAKQKASFERGFELLKRAEQLAPADGAVVSVVSASYLLLPDSYGMAPHVIEMLEGMRRAMGPMFTRFSHHGQQRLLLTLGEAYAKTGQTEKARASFDEALKINRASVEAELIKAELAKLKRNPPAAVVKQAAAFSREEVAFTSGSLLLKGTLFLPRSDKPVPAIVLLHGSGATKRDDNFYYAELFARHGVAALAYDKRGVGASQGDPQAWRFFSYEDLAADAAAGVGFLQTHQHIDARRVGLFGAGQGGTVAPLAAIKCRNLAFLVQLSASANPVEGNMLFGRAARLRAEGFTDEELAEAREMQLVDLEVTRGKRFDEFQSLWEKNKNKRWFRQVYSDEKPMAPNHQYRRWERTLLDYDPVAMLQKLDAPIFWLYGDAHHNRYFDVKQSLERVETLRRSGKRYEVFQIAGADHNLQLAKGGDIPAIWQKPLFDWLAALLR